ncbi:MAG: dihydrolipoyl dehydrogenase [Desulfobacteraceae bacterium]
MADRHTSLAIIGGGPGGYAAAFLAADLGLQATLIDPEVNPGGACLYRGCIPSKALLHVARLLGEARAAWEWGVHFAEPKIEIDQLRGWKQKVVNQLTGGLGRLAKERKIAHVRGTAVFEDARTLKVTDVQGGESTLGFEQAVIASGSEPVLLPGFDGAAAHIWTSRQALEMTEIPKRLLVIGGGYIGLELGTVYAALGSRVTVAEMTPHLLPGVDRELVRFLRKGIDPLFEQILLQTTAREPRVQKNGVEVGLKNQAGEVLSALFDKILVAVGRRPNTRRLGLEKVGVQVDDHGFIRVDGQRHTTARGIFAVGDVAGQPMLAHKASHEARIAVEVIAGKNVIYEPAAVPAVVFTDPEVAWAGVTEAEAKERGLGYKVSRYPWSASGRSITLGRSDGLTKLVVDAASERILGAGIVGPGAGELIAEAVVAIEMAATVTDLGLCIHPHPTLSETLKEAAEIFHGTATHIHRPKRK